MSKRYEDPKFNISINFNLDKSMVRGRKIEQTPQVVVNQLKGQKVDENDSSIINLPTKTLPKKKKKKTKKKSPKLTDQKSQTKQVKPKKKIVQNQLPWGLNQERLKNYFISEQQKQYNALIAQQKRLQKQENDLRQRRDQLGVSFLNQMPPQQVRNKIKKSKTITNSTIRSDKYVINKDEIKLFKLYKFRQMEERKQFQKVQGFEKQAKIQQNLHKLNDFIKTRNRSLSCDHKAKKKQRAISHTNFYDAIPEDSKENLVSDRIKKRKVVLQFKQNKQQSDRQHGSSIYQYLSNSSSGINIPNESDPEQEFGNIDDSFYSQKINLVTLGNQEYQFHMKEDELLSSHREWDEQDKREIAEIRNIEKAASKINSEKPFRSQVDEQLNIAAIKIQKMWRGYKTRQILDYYLDYFKQEEDVNEIDLEQLQESQIKELLRMGYLTFDSKGKLQVKDIQESFAKSEKSIKSDKSIKSVKSIVKAGFNFNFIDESPINQKQVVQKPIEQQYPGFKKKKRLSIDVEEIEKDYQNQVDIAEIRMAIGSEKLLKSLTDEKSELDKQSIFEQDPFQEFTMKKFQEFLQREKMDELIQMRQKAIEDRHVSQKKAITEALTKNKISPRTYDIQSKKLEKWVTKQKSELEDRKKDIEKGFKSTFETVMKTQRDLLFMKQISASNSQSYIKVIDSFSQESVASMRNSSIIDINLQNSQLPKQDDLSRSQVEDEILFQQTSSPSRTQQTEPDLPSESFNLQKLAQSQMLRISDIVREQAQPQMSDKQADSYAIVISNMIIANELQILCQELARVDIDIIEQVNRAQIQIIKPSKVPKGIKTNIQTIKVYLNNLVDHLRSYSEDIISQINIPVGLTSRDMLKFLHVYQNDDSIDAYAQNIILHPNYFKQCEKLLVPQQKAQFLQDLEHIHNKALFDALNEAMDLFRPYGLKGQPFVWCNDPIRLKQRNKKIDDADYIFKKSFEKVIEWCQGMVGIIIDKEDSPFPSILMFDQEYLAQIKEDRMLRMIQQEVIDTDDRWVNYDEEHAEVAVDLSDCIFDHLIAELAQELI